MKRHRTAKIFLILYINSYALLYVYFLDFFSNQRDDQNRWSLCCGTGRVDGLDGAANCRGPEQTGTILPKLTLEGQKKRKRPAEQQDGIGHFWQQYL